jgi:hypothetical protein
LGVALVAEDIEEFTTKPVVELDIGKLFEEEYKKVFRELLEKFIHIAQGYFSGIAHRASQLLGIDIYPSFSYEFQPDGILFTIKYTIDPKSIDKLKRQVMEKVEKKWIRIKLAEKYQRNRETNVAL